MIYFILISAGVSIGKVYEFQSVNYKTYSIKNIANGLVYIKPQSEGVKHFKVVRGLAGSGVSFQLEDNKNMYLRNQGFILKALPNDNTPLFKNDATFTIEKGLTGEDGTVSFKSFNYPTRYLRHQNSQLKLHINSKSKLFTLDASWSPKEYTGIYNPSCISIWMRQFLAFFSLFSDVF